MTTTIDETTRSRADAVGLHFDARPFKLCGWAAPFAEAHAADELVLSLMAGDVLLGTLRRNLARPDVDGHLGYKGPPCGFSVIDFGLSAFARLTGLRDLAVVARRGQGDPVRHALPEHESELGRIDPLGSRGIAIKGIRLTDAWLQSGRDLTLRFEGPDQAASSVTLFQMLPGAEPVLVALSSAQVVGGQVSLAGATLLNPFLPVLLVFTGIDGAIDGIDVMPFPSLVRGGLHEAERLIASSGSDAVGDTANLSATLLSALLARGTTGRGVAQIVIDPATHAGTEPILSDDLLTWIVTFLGVAVTVDAAGTSEVPDFILERLARYAGGEGDSADGHRLHLPSDCIPTIAALVNAFPPVAPQRLVGAMAIADWHRQGRIWSVAQPAMDGDWHDGLQGRDSRQFAPSIELRARAETEATETGRSLALPWPLAIARRERATRVAQVGPFEQASEIALPLLRNGALPDGGVSALILCDSPDQSVVLLLESLVRQQGVGRIDVTVSRPTAKRDADLDAALESLFPGRHRVVAQAAGLGRLERLKALADAVQNEQVAVIDAATILADPRTLATLLPMLASPVVATAGCLVRSASGKLAAQSAGYAPTGFDLRGVPALSFGSIDPEALRQPSTYPVVANSTALMVTTKERLAAIDARGSSAARPEIDDVLFGLQSIDCDAMNLCTTLVSVYSDRPVGKAADLAVSVPFRLSTESIARAMAATTIVQTIR